MTALKNRMSRSRARSGNYADKRYRNRALRILASFAKAKPDNSKKWISQQDHNLVLYGGLVE